MNQTGGAASAQREAADGAVAGEEAEQGGGREGLAGGGKVSAPGRGGGAAGRVPLLPWRAPGAARTGASSLPREASPHK